MRKKLSNELPDPFDNAAKIVFQNRPADVIKFATGYESPIIQPLRTSLAIRRKREVDVLAKIKIPSARNPTHPCPSQEGTAHLGARPH